MRLAVQARHAQRFALWRDARALADVERRDRRSSSRYLGLAGIERAEAGSLSYGGQRLLDMGLALATAPRILLLDEPLAGLAAAERQRIGDTGQAHLGRHARAAGRARHRPRVPDRRRTSR